VASPDLDVIEVLPNQLDLLRIEQADNPDPFGRLYAVFADDIADPGRRLLKEIADLPRRE